MNYFWLNCGYNRFNHFENLIGQVSIFDSSVHFNPSEGYAAFKRAQVGDKVIFYQVQNKIGLLGAGTVVKFEEPRRGRSRFILNTRRICCRSLKITLNVMSS